MMYLRIAAMVLAMLLTAPGAFAEIVKVTSPRAPIYDGQQWTTLPEKAQGRRFMVYGRHTDAEGHELFWIQLSAAKQTFAWIRAQDVAVDWGTMRTARVATVQNANTLELADGTLVQFCQIIVPMEETPLARQTLAWLKTLLEGKEVTLELDPKIRRNEHGYDVAYVYVGSLFVNRTLVEKGLARLVVSTTTRARYDDVFGYFVQRAKKAGLGIWASEQPPEESPPPEHAEQPQPTPQVNDSDRTYVRTLTDAERAQWARNLVTEIRPSTKRSKENKDRDESDGSTTRIEEITEVKTLNVTVKNGWGFPLQGLSATYEFFAKTGKTSSSVLIVKDGTVAAMDLKPGETRQFVAGQFEFKGKDAEDEGWSGAKYYGYRMTFLYKGTPVKVVADPTWLVNYSGTSSSE